MIRFYKLIFLIIAVPIFGGCKENVNDPKWDDELVALDSGAQYDYYAEAYDYADEEPHGYEVEEKALSEVNDPDFNYDEAIKKKYGIMPVKSSNSNVIKPLPSSANTLSVIMSICLLLVLLLSWKINELIPFALKILYMLMAIIGLLEISFCLIPDIFPLLTKNRLVNAVLFIVLQIGVFLRITGFFRRYATFPILNSITLACIIGSLSLAFIHLGIISILDALLGGVLSIIGFIVLLLVAFSIYKGLDDPPSPASSNSDHRCRHCYHYGTSTCLFDKAPSPGYSCGHFTKK